MLFEEIKQLIITNLGSDVIIETNEKALQPYLQIQTEKIAEVGKVLHENGFDHLACITGMDNGATIGTMEVIYHLYAILHATSLTLKVKIFRNSNNEPMPTIPTLSAIWRAADWHEREVYDFFGIAFEGHPDMRRILLPADWQGFPLRKDYEAQTLYRGIQVKY
ncbi:MAG: NADH-quinone oxidoreductase subunit C [Cytophagales bacterium]|nr:MAG: NADH-quinone oxidoreductase subunit C [Cytophagales bacterium]